MINTRHSLKYIMLLIFTLLAHKVSAGVGTTIQWGTLGYGGDVTWRLGDKTNARLNLNIYNMSGTVPVSNSNAQVKLNLQTMAGLYDWHPWEGGVRFSVGAVINNNKFKVSAVPSDIVEINNIRYSVKSFDGKIDFNKLAPYIGFGYGNAAGENGHWHFALDIGVIFQGSPKVSVNATEKTAILQPILDRDLEKLKSHVENEIKNFKIYPVISFGISYAFWE